mgnify:CR=1 FL=1
MINSKKGQDSLPMWAVGLIILMLSFGVLLLFYFLFPWQSDVSKAACQASIETRSKLTFAGVEFKDLASLRCQTERICFVSGSSSRGCDSLGKSYARIKIKDKYDILEKITDNMYEWYSTFGNGLLNPMESKLAIIANSCFMLSIYSFDEATRKEVDREGGITYADIIRTLEARKNQEGESYLRSFYGVDSAEEYFSKANTQLLERWNLPLSVSKDWFSWLSFVRFADFDPKTWEWLYREEASKKYYYSAPVISVFDEANLKNFQAGRSTTPLSEFFFDTLSSEVRNNIKCSSFENLV